VQLFYNQIQSRINLPFEQVSPRLRKQLIRQRRLQNRAQLIARLKKEGRFELLLRAPPPALAIIDTAGRPTRGQPSAPVTIVKFADFRCPNCKRAVSVFDDLLKKYPQDIKLVFMNLPVKSSEHSRQIAHGSVCAQNQGKFWAYHDAAYRTQSSLKSPSPANLAEQIGASIERFEQCMQDRGTHIKVQASIDEARRLGVKETPTIFVDGRPFPSNHLLKDLGAYIERKKAGAS
jgi:protein-disulfide isomerase